MALSAGTARTDFGDSVGEPATGDHTRESAVSAVSWGAIIGGAFVAVAVSLMLVALGSGIGLASVSPWSGSNTSPTTFTVVTAIWLILVQWLSSGMGGYITGRLRTKWVGVHTHEVFFRDTAHGFLVWAVASVVVVALATSTVSSIAGGSVRAASNVASAGAAGAAQGAATQSSGATGYFVDTLFRSDQPSANTPEQETRGEATRILARAVTNPAMDPGDRTYLAKLIAARAGISQADAEKRVDDVVAQEKAAEQKAREAADAARKAAASVSFFTFFSMLIGAFIASVAAAIGGRQRDENLIR
jgi:hypothetical protein